jgi:hypothetical protein
VVAAAQGQPGAVEAPPPRRDRRPLAMGIGAVVVAAAVVFVVVRGGGGRTPSTGARVATEREEIRLGRRGVAVAEAGAALSWIVGDDGTARVEQTSGDVFYRVDPGGPFVVATSAGDVRVTGTCFRVEIQPMKPSRGALIGAAVSAAVTATVVVSVYEGGIVVAGAGGEERRVAAGERAVIGSPDEAPTPVSVALADAPPEAAASREELLARDTAHREMIRELSVRVAGLQKQLVGARAEGDRESRENEPDPSDDGSPWFAPSETQLAEFAKECKIRFDTPPIDQSTPFQLSARDAESYGVAPEEIDRVNTVLREIHESWRVRLVALYIEATGDTERADSMSPSALAREIEDKAAPGEREEIQARLAQERAGLVAPPTDLTRASPLERYLRGITVLGDEFEQKLGAVIGPDRAHQLRTERGAWDSRAQSSYGCPGE